MKSSVLITAAVCLAVILSGIVGISLSAYHAHAMTPEVVEAPYAEPCVRVLAYAANGLRLRTEEVWIAHELQRVLLDARGYGIKRVAIEATLQCEGVSQ
jgi:hypothetical protein